MRLKTIPKDQLDPEQLALYEAIAGGPRAKGRQLFPLTDDHGALNGPFGIMVHFPGLGLPLQELGAAIRYRTGLSDRIRELAILCVAQVTDSAFERYAHELVGRAAGLSETELMDLALGRFISPDPAESTAYAFCKRLMTGDLPIADGTYDDLCQAIGEAAIFELITLVGYYRTLAQLLNVYDVGLPAETKA